jgi:hypothetical protein
MTIQDRMKKYAELRMAGIWNRHNTDALYEDFQAAMRALDVALVTLEHYAYIDNSVVKLLAGFKQTPDMVDNNSPANKALSTINEIMGEK